MFLVMSLGFGILGQGLLNEGLWGSFLGFRVICDCSRAIMASGNSKRAVLGY